MDSVLQDFRYAVRSLAKSPGFAVVTLLTLALGIGANSAIFSVVNGVLIRSMPYADADQLVVIRETYAGDQTGSVSGPNFMDWRERGRQFVSMAATRGLSVSLVGVGEPEEMSGTLASADFFKTLGVTLILGRGFLPGEDQGQGTVAVISETLWRNRFGADSTILGRTINVSGKPYTVIGVAPAWLTYPGPTQIWMPLGFGLGRASDRDSHSYDVVARLKPSASLSAAQNEVTAIAASLSSEHPDMNAGRGAKVIAFTEDAVGSIRPALLLLSGAVGFVLLIACANVANLFLARAVTRQREVAVRAALGATRWRLVRQVLAEALLLAGLGGALGLLVATWSIDGLLALKPRGIPRLSEISMDGRVLAFTLAVSVIVGLAFGIVPALVAGRHDPGRIVPRGGEGYQRRPPAKSLPRRPRSHADLACAHPAGRRRPAHRERSAAGWCRPGLSRSGGSDVSVHHPECQVPGCQVSARPRHPRTRAAQPDRGREGSRGPSSSCRSARDSRAETFRWRALRRLLPGTSSTQDSGSSWAGIWRRWTSPSSGGDCSARETSRARDRLRW